MHMEPQLLESLTRVVAGFIVSWLLKSICQQWIRIRSLRAALRRQRTLNEKCKMNCLERALRERNETAKALMEAFLRGPLPTLDELVNRIEDEWSLKHSPKR
jgi:hypothetical protein